MSDFCMLYMFLPRLGIPSRVAAAVEVARTAGIAGRRDTAEEERQE